MIGARRAQSALCSVLNPFENQVALFTTSVYAQTVQPGAVTAAVTLNAVGLATLVLSRQIRVCWADWIVYDIFFRC
jgi:threonine/homoserine/homoserine lactone efflux protein